MFILLSACGGCLLLDASDLPYEVSSQGLAIQVHGSWRRYDLAADFDGIYVEKIGGNLGIEVEKLPGKSIDRLNFMRGLRRPAREEAITSLGSLTGKGTRFIITGGGSKIFTIIFFPEGELGGYYIVADVNGDRPEQWQDLYRVLATLHKTG